MNNLVWRDDDINVKTDLKQFKQVHSLFLKYKVLHTVSLICKDIEQNKPIVKYLQKEKFIDVQIHAWDHYDFTKNIAQLREDLPKCIEVITRLFGKAPTVLYPPWNKSGADVEVAARFNKLRVSNQKISLEQYLKGVRAETINFHHWAPECELLEPALQKYTA